MSGGVDNGVPDGGIDGRVSKVASLIATARRLLSEGRRVDLSALEGKVGELCAALDAAGPDGSPNAAVAEIMDSLDLLAAELEAQHRSEMDAGHADASVEGGDSKSLRQRAARTYGRHYGKPEPDDR